MMRVLVAHGPHQLTFEERPKPKPGPGEVLVQTQAVGICGSDIHLYEGRHPYRVYPNIYGHEAVGVVAEVGEVEDARSKMPSGVLKLKKSPYTPEGTRIPGLKSKMPSGVRLGFTGYPITGTTIRVDGGFLAGGSWEADSRRS